MFVFKPVRIAIQYQDISVYHQTMVLDGYVPIERQVMMRDGSTCGVAEAVVLLVNA